MMFLMTPAAGAYLCSMLPPSPSSWSIITKFSSPLLQGTSTITITITTTQLMSVLMLCLLLHGSSELD